MRNYEYLIASLPELREDPVPGGGTNAEGILEAIRSQLDAKDNALVDELLKGWGEGLDAEFYKSALGSRNRFIRSYFSYDLDLRNTKVEYLNATLGRPEGQDQVVLPSHSGDYEFEDHDAIMTVLRGSDIIAKERGLDEFLWSKVDELLLMEVFSIDIILGFIVKLKITDRWEKLDPEEGAKLFRRLVEEIRSTYDNKKNNLS